MLKVVNLILADVLNNFKFIYDISYPAILISTLVAAITIFLSCVSSARKASKVTPIDLIRSSNDIKIKSKKIKCPKVISRVFNVGGEIAYKNLKRSKKKYRATIISLVVSIVTFIAISSFIKYGFNMSNVYYQELGYNFQIYYNIEDYKETYEMYKTIAQSETVQEYAIYKSEGVIVDYNKYFTEFGKKVNSIENINEGDNYYIQIYSIGEEAYKKYVKEIGIDYNKAKNGAILIDKCILFGEIKEEGEIYNLKRGDIFEGKTDDNNKIELQIVTRTDKKPMGLELTDSSLGSIIVSDEYMDKVSTKVMGEMYVNSSNPDKLANELDELNKKCNDKLIYSNYDEYVKQNNAFVLVVSIFLYGFIAVITAIGVTNIFNTITTNMNLRSKEFANLKSIGMTKKEFNRMIRLESIFYGTKSLVIRNTNRYRTIIFDI